MTQELTEAYEMINAIKSKMDFLEEYNMKIMKENYELKVKFEGNLKSGNI